MPLLIMHIESHVLGILGRAIHTVYTERLPVAFHPCSELDQSNVTEEAPEGEEHPPADSENK